MNRKLSILIVLSLLMLMLLAQAHAAECGAVPANNCTISIDTIFTTAVYNVVNLTFISGDITLDCDGSTLQGLSTTESNSPVLKLQGQDRLNITNCIIVNTAVNLSGSPAISTSGGNDDLILDSNEIQNTSSLSFTGENMTMVGNDFRFPTLPAFGLNAMLRFGYTGIINISDNFFDIDDIQFNIDLIGSSLGFPNNGFYDVHDNIFNHTGFNNNQLTLHNMSGSSFDSNIFINTGISNLRVAEGGTTELRNINFTFNTLSSVDFNKDGSNGSLILINNNIITDLSSFKDFKDVTYTFNNVISTTNAFTVEGLNEIPEDYTITDNIISAPDDNMIDITCFRNFDFSRNIVTGDGDNRIFRVWDDCSLNSEDLIINNNIFENTTHTSAVIIGFFSFGNFFNNVTVINNTVTANTFGVTRPAGNISVYDNTFEDLRFIDIDDVDICVGNVSNIVNDEFLIHTFAETELNFTFDAGCSPYTVSGSMVVVPLTSPTVFNLNGSSSVFIGSGLLGLNYTGTAPNFIIDSLITGISFTGYATGCSFDANTANNTITNYQFEGGCVDTGENNSFICESWQQVSSICDLAHIVATITYIDINACGTDFELPVDNGTQTSCLGATGQVIQSQSNGTIIILLLYGLIGSGILAILIFKNIKKNIEVSKVEVILFMLTGTIAIVILIQFIQGLLFG